MSIQAVGWVLDHSPTKKLERLVLISLANHANEAGECWPSVERIAAEAGTTVVQARRILGTLEEGGHIVRAINAAPDSRMRGDRRTNLYRILDGGALSGPPWADGRAPSASTGARSARERAAAERAPNHQGTISEPSETLLPAGAGAPDRFDEFWQAYPKARRLAKPDARRAWRDAIKRAPAETIIAAVIRYEADPNRLDEFTPYPQKWLRQERWNAPPEPRRASSGAQGRQARNMAAAAAFIAKANQPAQPRGISQ